MFRWLRRLFTLSIFLAIAGVVAVWILFGGGQPYEDLTTDPVLPRGTIEAVVTSDRPIGNVAVSASGRIFYTIHPESKPEPPFVYEWTATGPQPFPASGQAVMFESPLGVAIDRRGWLWVIDPAHHGTATPRLVALGTATGDVMHRHIFGRDVAPWGSFLQDLQVSPDGRWIYIADAGFWRKRPALIVYDTERQVARRVLERHPSLYPQNLLIRNQIRNMSFYGGILQMKVGLDGIALSRDGDWLYYGAMTHDTLYRLPTEVLTDSDQSDGQIAGAIQRVGQKPLSDGLSTDDAGNVFITDVEHQAVVSMAPDGTLTTLVKDDRIRWADGLSFGPGGWLYLADSAIPHLVLQDAATHAANAPYHVWRFQPGTRGAPGQ